MTSNNTDILVKESRNGSGVFTNRDFVADEAIFQITGPFMTCNEDDDISDEDRANTYRYDDDLYVSPKGTVGNFFNHSCNPNAKIVKEGKHLFVRAIKAIPEGREIFFDYSTLIASDDSWKMKCNCGSALCRKSIGKFKFLPKELREKYTAKKIVPNYILEI